MKIYELYTTLSSYISFLVSGTDIYLVGGLIGGGLATQEGIFGTAYNKAENRMISKAKENGANAIISVQTTVCSPGNLNNIKKRTCTPTGSSYMG